jgi:KDO2-lipid IV(A) lauroyltransferase
MKYRPKHIVEYALLRGVMFLSSVLPYRAALGVGWFMALIAFHVFRFRRRETMHRLRSVFGDRFTDKEYRHIAWISLRNLAFNAIEFMANRKMTREDFDRIFEYGDTLETMQRQVATGKGAVLAGPHMGTWEMVGRAFALNGVPIISIAAHQRNPLVNAYFDRMRAETELKPLTRGEPGILKKIIRRMRNGEVMAILPDVRMRTPALEVPFLGGTANIGTGAATFARTTGLPIFPFIIKRRGWSHHEMKILPIIYPDMSLDKTSDIERMMRILMDGIDREIMAEPEQWFWYNKRWILEPIDKTDKHKKEENNDTDK